MNWARAFLSSRPIVEARRSQTVASVIVAVFNNRETLGMCIESFRSQSLQEKELIVIDGGSTDGSVGILRDNEDAVSYWKSEPDTGIYNAWNKGLSHARGEWISFLGADDVYASEHSLAEIVLAAEQSRAEIVTAKMGMMDCRGKVGSVKGEPWNWESIKRHHSIAHPGMLYNRSCFDKHGKFNEKYRIAGDYDLSLRMGSGVRAIFLDRVIVHAGSRGVSRSNIGTALSEVRQIQSEHPEIGRFKAAVWYCVVWFKILLRKMSRTYW